MSLSANISKILSLSCLVVAGTATAAGIDPGVTAASGRAPLNAKQLAEANARLEVAKTILANVSADAEAKNLDAAWQINLLSSLYNVNSAALQDVAAAAHSVDMAYQLARAASIRQNNVNPVAKALGSTTTDLVFTPKTPCRFIDTRVTGGPITGPTDYDTFFFGNSYGGSSSCTLPGHGEPGVVANVTVIVPAGGGGYLGIRPYGSTNTTSFINWSSAGAPAGLANAGIISTALNGSDYVFEVFKGGAGSPQLVLDYFGYFAPAAATALTCTNTFADQSLGANTSAGTFYYSTACTTGSTPVAPFCDGHAVSGVYLAGSGISGNSAFCEYKNLTSGALPAAVGVTCCYVP